MKKIARHSPLRYSESAPLLRYDTSEDGSRRAICGCWECVFGHARGSFGEFCARLRIAGLAADARAIEQMRGDAIAINEYTKARPAVQLVLAACGVQAPPRGTKP